MELVVGAALGMAGVLLVVLGRRGIASSNSEKMSVLSQLDGMEVILGLNGPRGRDLIVPRRGQLHVEDAAGRSVVLADEKKERVIHLGQIRWIEDPLTGTRHGGRW